MTSAGSEGGKRRTGRARDPDAPKRLTVALACSVCHARNYKTTKARKDGSAALKLKKFCKACDAHTVHEETR